ncbi:hypothetical protein [Bradyrhizobium elkanii]|nr:hypothetical protein [Bradyrhizobium elkanii]WLA81968.1 hypothetical protein QNJ99_42565 [Bradyrhizobium elkanii]
MPESCTEVGKRIERLNVGQDPRKFERCVIAQFGSSLATLFADVTYFGG